MGSCVPNHWDFLGTQFVPIGVHAKNIVGIAAADNDISTIVRDVHDYSANPGDD